jgi:hypothetical protein
MLESVVWIEYLAIATRAVRQPERVAAAVG